MTVKQLINNGYFDEKFFDKDIYHDRINDNTFIEIKQGTNADNTNVIIHDGDSTQKDCEMSAINTTLGEIELEDKESYTDRINISVKPKSDEINLMRLTFLHLTIKMEKKFLEFVLMEIVLLTL